MAPVELFEELKRAGIDHVPGDPIIGAGREAGAAA